ncbi:anucleate primary sterigmata protein B [Podospora didyma]|uniref:Anucleate primary sterigmata protein B n=1 Tax=Podospora didyma TaxID=330526 RepID=A0AAE0NPG2_9PEZI|nr:anucleate primary sterigmata protein B [Podospora didyma]
MDDVESPDSRPSTAHRNAPRKVPGSFDDDVISPLKENFDDGRPALPSVSNATALKPENIPPLHPPVSQMQMPESSFMEGPSLELRHSDSQAEIAVRQHLQDIESSFTVPLSPIPASNNGVDDTFLFDSPTKKHQKPRASPRPQLDADETLHESQVLPSPSHTPPGAAPGADESQLSESDKDRSRVDVGNGTSSLEAFSSSPTAAAAARTISRAVSQASAVRTEGARHDVWAEAGDTSANTDDQYSHHDQSDDQYQHQDQTDDQYSQQSRTDNEDSRLDPRGSQYSHQDQIANRSDQSSQQSDGFPDHSERLRHRNSDQSLHRASLDAGHTPGQALKVAKQRPKYLRSRNASQRSSISSLITDPDSDVTVGLGTDYALQSGGAVPSLGMQRSMSNLLSRSISMGSMASGIEDLHDYSGPGFGQLETLEEVDRNMSPQRSNLHKQSEELLQTPKAKRNSAMAAPTDTVIARHVRDVQVPESLAREYKTKGGLVTPRKPQDFNSVGGLGTSTTTSRHGGKSLTLKEQSSTIERLSKENFDLKLKVMFLSDRLDKLSEEGIKEMISENVELKTGLAVLQRDNKMLRRRVKELEKQMKDDDARPGTARSTLSDDESAAYDHQEAQEREEELIYLREQMEEYVTEIERLRTENMNKENEKRRMAEVVRSLGERAGERMGESMGRQEEADVWKDLLEQETARREQGDEDNRRLRDEVFRLKQELAAHAVGGALHHTTNIYNITKKQRDRQMSPSRPTTAFSGDMDINGNLSAGSTLVEDLRRESEQLRHENAELRREVGAQTSMLTSRNREKERLYQEIEDLKMAQRRGGPAPSTIDSLLERSASRAGAHERSQSRASGGTRAATALDELDREELENKLAELRDKNNTLKLQNQDLQRELDACMEDFETAVRAKKEAEEVVVALQDDLDTAMNDLMALQAERDEALQEHANLENEFEALRKEAQEEIDALEAEGDQRNSEIERLHLELNDRAENFDALQEEMRKMSDALVRFEDEQEAKMRRIQQLEQELGDANKELEDLETKLLEANDKANRLSVQQESSQGEIAFLREEQEGDKIRIGDLEAALAHAEQSIREEKENASALEERLATERRQREIVANREKEEVQQFVNDLNRETSNAKDEARRLRKNLTSREVEAAEWKQRLIELENNLREALGDLNGTRSSLLKSIAKLQRDLENTMRDLDQTKNNLLEKDRIIKQRDSLLESHSLESRRLAEMLDKERLAHRNTKHAFETFQKTHQHVTRTVSSQDSRIVELENSKAQDKKRIAQLEASFKDQLTERNNLLLVLWTRLSSLCGSDWAHDNSLINGRALPSLEAVATMLPGFSKNLLAAVKTIETMISGFSGKIKSVEKDLWREYQTLESHLDMRTKKLERIEAVVRSSLAAGTLGTNEAQNRLTRLEEAYRQLKVENHTLRTAAEVRARAAYAATGDPNGVDTASGGSPSPSVPTGPKAKSRIPKTGGSTSSRGSSNYSLGRSSSIARATSSHRINLAADELNETPEGDEENQQNQHLQPPGTSSSNSGGGLMENKWMLRLRDMEYKLKAEREARLLDRGEAMKRINASEAENIALRENLEREKRRQGGRA